MDKKEKFSLIWISIVGLSAVYSLAIFVKTRYTDMLIASCIGLFYLGTLVADLRSYQIHKEIQELKQYVFLQAFIKERGKR